MIAVSCMIGSLIGMTAVGQEPGCSSGGIIGFENREYWANEGSSINTSVVYQPANRTVTSASWAWFLTPYDDGGPQYQGQATFFAVIPGPAAVSDGERAVFPVELKLPANVTGDHMMGVTLRGDLSDCGGKAHPVGGTGWLDVAAATRLHVVPSMRTPFTSGGIDLIVLAAAATLKCWLR